MQTTLTDYLNQNSCLLLTFFNQFVTHHSNHCLFHTVMMPTNVKINTNVDYISWLFFLSPWWISELVLSTLLQVFIQLLIITIPSFALIFIEAVIMICVIVLIFSSIAYTTDISGVIFEEQHVANKIKWSLVFSAFRRVRWKQK